MAQPEPGPPGIEFLDYTPPRRFAVVLVASGAMLAVLSVKFATWGWAG